MKRNLAFLLAFCLTLALTLPVSAAGGGELDRDVLPTLKALEIMVGDAAGNLNLSAPVSRSEFAKLLVASSLHKDDLGGQGAGWSLFTDVKSTHWASEYIKLCLDEGWMIGYTDGSFRPDNTVTLEEACTAALRLLGIDSASLSGSFPAAQLSRAKAVGLRDGMDAVQGQALTRQDCAQLFYNLLTCKTAQGQVYALTLGYTLDEDEKVDYLAAVKEDLEGPFVCGGAAPALGFVPAVTYLNDKAVSTLDWKTDDVYYYAGDYLWVYRDQVFGQISAVSVNGSTPTAVNVDGKNYTLGSDDARDQVTALGSQAAGTSATLLLGMDGQVANLRAVTGPFVANSGQSLDFVPQTVYRNGELSSNATLSSNDVYYLDESTRTMWVCTDQVSGKIEALTPNALAPTAVTISGKSYTLGGDEPRRLLSSLNGKWTGKFVTLLFGLDDTVVGVLTDEAVDATYYGVVQSATREASDGTVEQRVTAICTDGRSHTFSDSLSHEWEAGDLVQAAVTSGQVTLSPLSAKSLSSSAHRVTLAADVRVLDAAEDGDAAAVDAADLAGVSLSGSNVRFYALNAAGEVTDLILNDATGALWSYGYLSELERQDMGMSVSNRYTLMLDGQSRVLSVSGKSFPVTVRRGVALRLAADGSIAEMTTLSSASLVSVGKTSASTGTQAFSLADDVQVYLEGDDDDFYAVELSDLDLTDRTLTGWYDAAQKEIRVITVQ